MHPIDALICAHASPRVRRLLVMDAPGLVDQARLQADEVLVWCDDLRERALIPADLVVDSLDVAALGGVDEVWLRLPRAVGAVDEYGELIAAHADRAVRLVAAGRDKQMSLAMNEALGRSFTQVQATLGRQKCRALIACAPQAITRSWPRNTLLGHPVFGDNGLRVYAHGATFAALRLDLGTRLLLDCLDRVAEADRYCDLGCGSGVIAAALARAFPTSEVTAVDVTWSATDAARLTCGTQVQVHQGDGLAGWDAHSLDVICCNPPFHRGNAKDSAPTLRLFEQAAGALIPGGEFWCVFNSHLPWRRALGAAIGPTRTVARTASYTLTRSVRSDRW